MQRRTLLAGGLGLLAAGAVAAEGLRPEAAKRARDLAAEIAGRAGDEHAPRAHRRIPARRNIAPHAILRSCPR